MIFGLVPVILDTLDGRRDYIILLLSGLNETKIFLHCFRILVDFFKIFLHCFRILVVFF